MVSALDRKLLRDLRTLKGQVLTIALVVACGIASFVALQSTWHSLAVSRDTYYERYRFGEVFAHLERAPDSLGARIEAIPGVARSYTRVVEQALVPMPGRTTPAVATLVSLPGDRPPPLGAVYLRAGRMIEPGRDDEALVIDSFAQAHGLQPGDSVAAVINGKLRRLELVGIALSPEYIFTMAPGALTMDTGGTAVLWMDEAVLAPAFQMESAFNDVVLDLQPGASEPEVLRQLDALLAPYGGRGALPRAKQPSNFMLADELSQLEGFATTVPTIFLSVAAFLLYIVLSRVVHLQRTQIATLKAVGYRGREIGAHYLKLVSVIVALGAALGMALGAQIGSGITGFYGQFYRFPVLVYELQPQVIAGGVLISMGAAVAGALAAVRRIARMPPAEAMRPPSPPVYRRGVLDHPALTRLLGTSTVMVMRELRRQPLRLLLSSLGIAAAVGIMVTGSFGFDSVEFVMRDSFHRENGGDLMVNLLAPVPASELGTLAHLPGVLDVEGTRAVPVRFRSGPVWRDSSIMGLADEPRLRRIVDREARVVTLPREGLALSKKLGEILGVGIGDRVEIEVKEGQRRIYEVPVAALIDDTFGLQGYMHLSPLHALLGEDSSVNALQLRIDPLRAEELDLQTRLVEIPNIARVTEKRAVVASFYEQTGASMGVMSFVLGLFAAIIAVGVVYNNARVALSMRSRDLASLRVLGFTRAEISAVLLGELSVQLLVALPMGLLLGTWWAQGVMGSIDAETYRLPIVISKATYAQAVLVTLGAGLASALLVRRKLDSLDLIGVLKSRE
ncbi:ABC transporter permease [Haliangium ochraceum]|uniref:ABC3 transporter permease C-terminal domain-containing protein n=1 Tax=Haliangium ochraceum (strain DSM 14365 / JCM 11303 / SMP-2) TaxID=502025 RepID=D0LIT7_HALO1|nr:ABC transporter permease [Haliangium ochraceum]ACY12966.1 protein of unknown function DUF214 [Haliangium ochraceum DSM 14365]